MDEGIEDMPDLFVLSIVYCIGTLVCEPEFNKTFTWPEPLESLGECVAIGEVVTSVMRFQGKKIIVMFCEGEENE